MIKPLTTIEKRIAEQAWKLRQGGALFIDIARELGFQDGAPVQRAIVQLSIERGEMTAADVEALKDGPIIAFGRQCLRDVSPARGDIAPVV